jgi:hypothetical protein
VLALDSLPVFLTNEVSLSVHMTRICPPAVCVVSSDTKRLQQGLQAEKNFVLTPTEHIGQDLPCVMVDGVPEPAWMGFLAHVTPHIVTLCAQPTRRLQFVRTGYLHRDRLGLRVRQYRVVHLGQIRCLVLSSLSPGVGLTWNTRAVSRRPLAFMAISTI